MAGDWIKMRMDLVDDPAVIWMAEQLGMPEPCIVGYLHTFWSWCSRHCSSEKTGVGIKALAERLRLPDGFLAALAKTGWLIVCCDGCLEIPNWDRYLSESAKSRASTARRVEKHRGKISNACVTQGRYTSGPITAAMRKTILTRDGFKCVYCGATDGEVSFNESKSEGVLSIDHVIPASKGGDVTANNLVTCCIKCNRIKLDRTPDECGFEWPTDVTGKRYGSVTKALPEKRREEKSNTPYKSPKGDAPQQRYSQDFERWWLAYPKRVGKDAAARAFRVARTKVDRDELQRATERFAASPKGRGEFCWNPATWLNHAHWLDDPAEWQEARGGNGRPGEPSAEDYQREAERRYAKTRAAAATAEYRRKQEQQDHEQEDQT